MIVNKTITYYHKTLDDESKLEKWNRILFTSAWVYSGKSAVANLGYDDSNSVQVRIPMDYVKNANVFKIGDIIAIGEQPEIEQQKDLKDVEMYNVTSININDFGNNPHIHLGGK